MPIKVDDRYFIYPVWGTPTAARGGSGVAMEVVLGPDATQTYGSPTGATSIFNCMQPLNAKDFAPTKKTKADGTPITRGLWVAGHLLNDNLGGSGTDAENLTPLTDNANKEHAKQYENDIKTLIDAAYQRKQYYPKDPHLFGVYYKVEVVDQFGTFSPYSLAPSHILITASIVKVDKADGQIYDATQADIDITKGSDHYKYFNNFFAKFTGNVFQVDNDDADLTDCVNPSCMH